MCARNTLFMTTPIACAFALGILATNAQASAPILSVSNVITDSSNLGVGATITTSPPSVSTYSSSGNANYTTTTSSDFTSEVQTEPTTTAAGLAYDYETITTTNTWDHITWKKDYLSIGVISDGVNKSGDKWISLTGSVHSTIDTTLSFSLNASGSFTATVTPFGSTAPLLASFYFGEVQPTPLSAITSTNLVDSTYSTYSSSYSTASFSLQSGVSQSFVAYVYAPDDVSVINFQLFANTADYDFVTTPGMQDNIGPKILIGAHTLAPIPEPETYAMMLAGLALIGVGVRSRKQAGI